MLSCITESSFEPYRITGMSVILLLGSSRANVMTGDLPEDFLRLSPAMNQAAHPSGQMVPVQPLTYYQPGGFMRPYQQQPMGRLSVTIQQVCTIFITFTYAWLL